MVIQHPICKAQGTIDNLEINAKNLRANHLWIELGHEHGHVEPDFGYRFSSKLSTMGNMTSLITSMEHTSSSRFMANSVVI